MLLCPLSYVDIKGTHFSKDPSLTTQNIYSAYPWAFPLTYMYTHVNEHGVQNTKESTKERFRLRRGGRSGIYLSLRSICAVVGKCRLQQILHSIMTVHNGGHNDSLILLAPRREVIK